MSDSKVSTVTYSAPWMLLLTIFFILMKLNVFGWETKIMDFSWIWIFSPLWLPIALFLGIFVVVFLIVVIFGLIAVGIAALFDR